MTTRAALARHLHFAVGPLKERENRQAGPLSGKKLIVKDLFDVAGEPTSAGCDQPLVSSPSHTASAVEHLIAAGATYIGKAQMVQLAFGGWGTNSCAGAPRNPWDATGFRVAGGSSSGSAVAIAAGFADVALGSDTGGSIRIPASLCGVVGLRPSQSRVAMDGVVPLAPSLDSIGPMAATVMDIATAFSVLTDTPAVTAPASLTSLVIRTLNPDDLVAQPDIAKVYHDSVALLAGAGATIKERELPAAPGAYVAPTGQIMGREAWAIHGERITQGFLTADVGVLRRFRVAATIDEASYRDAVQTRIHDRRQFDSWFEGADFLLTPATARTAPLIADVDEGDFTLACYTRMANYLDLCAIALPCGFDRIGLPMGLQLIGRAGEEERLIAAAWAIERLLALPKRQPPLHVANCVN